MKAQLSLFGEETTEHVPSVMEFPHHVYILTDGYIGITASLRNRMKDHLVKRNATLRESFIVPTRREAEGVEATLHHIGEDFFCPEFYPLHSLWFHSGCKGYPKHLKQKPQLKF